jgi:hypothetical protein
VTRRWTLALCLLTVACSKHADQGHSTEKSAGATSSGRGAGKLCSLLTPAELGSLSGLEGLGEPTVAVRMPVTMCTFSNPTSATAVTLRFELGRSASDFVEIRKLHDQMGQKTTDLPGLGDAAASFTAGGYNGVTFLNAGAVVMVSGPAPIDHLVAVGRKIIERIGD